MSAPYIIPFDNCPVSVSVKTSSYTIPSGKYARVLANVKAGGTFTVDGTTALNSVSRNWSVLASDNLRVGTDAGSSSAANTLLAYTCIAGGLGGVGGAFNESTAYCETSETGEFWLPEGTVINGTGTWSGTVMLYNKIT